MVALLERAGEGARVMRQVLVRRLGARWRDAEAIADEARKDPAFEEDLRAALAWVNPADADDRVLAGLRNFRNRDAILESPPEDGLRLIGGLPGSGRTELARKLADAVWDHYQTSLIEIDLDDFRDGDVLDRALVKRHVLREFGIAESEIQLDDAGLDHQFRTAMLSRRHRIILDNVRTARELELFEPFVRTPHQYLVLAVAAVLTPELQDFDPDPIRLTGLDEPGATELLADFAVGVRLADEPEVTAELLDLCGRTPAAIRELGRTLRRFGGEPKPVARLLARCQDPGLATTADRLTETVRMGFEQLPAETVRAAALLASFPGGRFTPSLAAAYVGGSTGEDEVNGVIDAQLTEPPVQGWYRLSPLVRRYARTLDEDRPAALDRLLRHVRDLTVRADLAGDPDRLREYVVPGVLRDELAAGRVPWTLVEDRFDWLDDKLVFIEVLARAASNHGRHVEVCQLAGAVEVFVNQRGRWRTYAEINQLGVQSAEILYVERGARGAALLARMLLMRSRVNFLARWFHVVPADLERARQLIAEAALPDRRRRTLLASAAEFEARFREEQADFLASAPAQPGAVGPLVPAGQVGLVGQDEVFGTTPLGTGFDPVREQARLLAEAEMWLRTAVRIDQEIDHMVAESIHLRMLAAVLLKAGQPGLARVEIERALALATERNRLRAEMVAARICLAAGDLAEARSWYKSAETAADRQRATHYRPELREIAAQLLTAEGDTEGAALAWGSLLYDSLASAHPRTNEYLRQFLSLPGSDDRRR
ncbi:hypothetical protein [Kribbella albertanoniae]|uniref:AAA+ ATPase domain-containing protein n=1 Tax=Kribbella albertanoniae TaxID=1266829 RepID=A0A4R4PUT6_9ACTN|nr:hypothetical protein [Kribbella albertanoniae]TDC26196.1 hypothetical protein E1261_22860 [Kribbella albertanoniae]